MIELSHLNKYYDAFHALKDIQLTVAPGEIVGVIGKSGAGKSTLIRCVNLLERPTSGSVRVNNVELTALNPAKLREARHHIGMIFQHFNLLATRTVYQNVSFPLQLLKKSAEDIKKIVLPLLDKVGLIHHQDAYSSQLSGGQKQRVAIARALATKPSVLLCDEMTSALDPETTEEILHLLRAINDEMHLSILCITHEMSVIKSIADRVAVMHAGKIVECADVIDIFKKPAHPITQRFVQSVLKSELPLELSSRLHDEQMIDDLMVLRLTFAGTSVLDPVIHEMMKQINIIVNILQANIEWLRREMIGCMIVSIDLNGKDLEKVLVFLRARGLLVEVMGYVDRQNWSY